VNLGPVNSDHMVSKGEAGGSKDVAMVAGSHGQGAFVDDMFHYEGAAQALDAGEGGQLPVVQPLEGWQVCADDA
jgi:hypothetical protein